MEVILLQRVEKLGQMGEVVMVKPGYARNFLLPKGKAARATKEKLEEFQAKRIQLEAHNLQLRKEAESVAAKMDGLGVILIRQAGDAGQLYGSIRAKDLVEPVKAAGFTVDAHQIVLEQPIKTLGIHRVRIALHPEVSVFMTVNIALTEEEAKAQAKRAAEEATPSA